MSEMISQEVIDKLRDDSEIITMNVSDLNPATYNPRKQLKPGDKDFQDLERSIRKFGMIELIVVNADTGNTVISGHQRLAVLKHIGIPTVKCLVTHFTEAEEKQANIAMNKIRGEWDLPKLATMLEMIKDMGELEFTGYSPEEADAVMSKVHDKNVKEDDFDVDSELKQPAFSRPGDIWHLGKHTVLCGDSTDPMTYETLMAGVKANLLLTDPPYMVSYQNSSGKIQNDSLNDKDAYQFLLKAFTGLLSALAEDAATYVFYATSKSRIFYDAYEDAGFQVFTGLTWKKDRAVLSRGDFNQITEPIIYGKTRKGTHKFYGDAKNNTCLEFPRLKSSKEEGYGHPTSKPVPLIGHLIKLSTMTNGIVLDGFLGSASTLIACEQLGRICYGVELEPKFVDVAVKRYISFKEGHYDDVHVVRDGQKLAFDEVATFDKEGGDPL